eukprot:TRINITY_DN2494_c0_g1_i1.p1 TRINITY_DN2494_c0_g1~~TRINITY_DN2494_c0_g1_i1.p1  ORF type:complete len:471 (+),score=88.41 TRINITY_DN2494_c0_g1_i1:198-1610(+)
MGWYQRRVYGQYSSMAEKEEEQLETTLTQSGYQIIKKAEPKQESQEVPTEEEKKLETSETEENKKVEPEQKQQQISASQPQNYVPFGHQFWDKEPVPQTEDYCPENAGIIEKKTLDQVQKTPYTLLANFEWEDIDLSDDKVAMDVYELLRDNYVEDDDNMFRFDYSVEFLRWALLVPNNYKEWLVGVRVSKSKKLVGFISGVPVHMILNQKDKVKMAEINFLCVHKKLRANRLAPLLIKEVTRRINRRNIWQAVYTAGVKLPTPVAEAQYFHRSLNPKKLIESNFSSKRNNQPMSMIIKLYKVPEETQIPGIRPMAKKDIAPVYKLLISYLEKFDFYNKYTEEEVKHFFLPRKGVISTYVVEKNKQVTDFFSFYSLPSSILKNPKHTTLKAAYSFYNVANTVSFKELMLDALIVAKQEEFDVFNALNIMENDKFIEELNFCPGDGNLHFYLYNWRMPRKLLQKDLGMVLV